MASINHGDDFVCRFNKALSRFGKLLMGNGFAFISEEAFNARIINELSCAVTRKVDERTRAILGCFCQLVKRFQNIFFGSVSVFKVLDLSVWNAHGIGNLGAAGHVKANTIKHSSTCNGVFGNANDQRTSSRSRLRENSLCNQDRDKSK